MGGYLSGTIVTDRLKRFSKRDRKKTNPCPSPCFRPGFTEPAPLDAAGALLPHLCTLTEPEPLTIQSPKTILCRSKVGQFGWGIFKRLGGSAVFFCGTILTIARTGRYPASLVFRKPGLSSDDHRSPLEPATASPSEIRMIIRNRLAYTLRLSSLSLGRKTDSWPRMNACPPWISHPQGRSPLPPNRFPKP